MGKPLSIMAKPLSNCDRSKLPASNLQVLAKLERKLKKDFKKNIDEAIRIIEEIGMENDDKSYKMGISFVGQFAQDNGDVSLAEDCYRKAEEPLMLFKLQLKKRLYESASKTLTNYPDIIDGVLKQVNDIIPKLVQKDRLHECEMMLTATAQYPKMLQLYAQTENYTDMTEFASRYQEELHISGSVIYYCVNYLKGLEDYKGASKIMESLGKINNAISLLEEGRSWEEAEKLAREKGGTGAAKTVIINRAKSMPNIEEGKKLLSSYGFNCDKEFALHETLNQIVQSERKSDVAIKLRVRPMMDLFEQVDGAGTTMGATHGPAEASVTCNKTKGKSERKLARKNFMIMSAPLDENTQQAKTSSPPHMYQAENELYGSRRNIHTSNNIGVQEHCVDNVVHK